MMRYYRYPRSSPHSTGTVYEVDDEDTYSYKTIVGDMMEYNDLHEYVEQYVEDEYGNGADVFFACLWDGAEYTTRKIADGFVEYVLMHPKMLMDVLDRYAEEVDKEESE